MAVVKQRLLRKIAANSYETIHLESSSDVILRSDGTSVEDALSSGMSIDEATTSKAGLMSASDKTKLNGIANNANNYSHPTSAAGAKSSGLYKIATDANGHITSASTVQKSDITDLGIPAQDTTYTHPTTAGYKHIPSGGSSNQILRYSSSGTAVWSNENTVSAYTSTPAMNGTGSAGSSSYYAKGDHVHPTDTSRAPTSHTSTGTTYGKATSSYYGHVLLSDSVSSTSAAASGGTAATPAAVKAAYDLAKSAAQITYGSYAGTDTYGSSNTNSLTFSFVPYLLIICKFKMTGSNTIVSYIGWWSMLSYMIGNNAYKKCFRVHDLVNGTYSTCSMVLSNSNKILSGFISR